MRAVGYPRSDVFYKPKGKTPLNLGADVLIDGKNPLHLWLGIPRIATWLRKDMGHRINKKRIERIFKLMGPSVTGSRPNTSKQDKGELHRIL